MQVVGNEKELFEKWDADDFIAVDDRVRGGKSQSFLEIDGPSGTARFYGHLDIKTLGNAGFASQATKSGRRSWNLSKYEGIRFTTLEGDNKNYSISFKNTFVKQTPDGSQDSTMEYKYIFQGKPKRVTQFVQFDQFRPTYRGRVVDAKPLNTSDIKVIQFQIASGFGQQQGPFSIKFQNIVAC
ncbi:NADH:ubiquinone oxidoreductase complex I intermediate-associated protein 30 [Basidiobolus meristosporus CBS 931.73]|uniref:NADH:ubiquinone oxidoreductase complex I intermediate-associated protein 30 n=1 Tax=Basidiobolus meristosporus CBS 931.73 TaxID=1314790 RepID=A0A1Y1XYE0_9FUNG|nr:NADH:ubiquinone oxidoreductase complex I intermediate-associated protein 30 [Basidiobolus meristosporus CBS 931.73]|eukprot:ORX90773.1 NADH:ubiquinone oxidoreductase complex I intermediate-associated protein 30 [Basidiobolus meristosporus CBS 931.73]